MKLICIKEHNDRFGHKIVSLGEIIEGEIGFPGSYRKYWTVIGRNNKSVGWCFPKDIFMSLAEYRELQINSILEETE